MKEYLINYEGKSYPCQVTFKRMRTITFRLSRDRTSLFVSCPYGTPEAFLQEKINLIFPRLMKRSSLPSSSDGDTVYIFGQKETIPDFSRWDPKQRNQYYRTLLLPYVQEKVAFYASLMDVKTNYAVKVRDMKSRYGVNSKATSTLTFALELVHYAPATIDSVIVHELAHYFVFNHSKSFYEVVYKYFPTYKVEHAKLRKHQYQ